MISNEIHAVFFQGKWLSEGNILFQKSNSLGKSPISLWKTFLTSVLNCKVVQFLLWLYNAVNHSVITSSAASNCCCLLITVQNRLKENHNNILLALLLCRKFYHCGCSNCDVLKSSYGKTKIHDALGLSVQCFVYGSCFLMEFWKQWQLMTPGRSAKLAVIDIHEGSSECGEYISGLTHFMDNNGNK